MWIFCVPQAAAPIATETAVNDSSSTRSGRFMRVGIIRKWAVPRARQDRSSARRTRSAALRPTDRRRGEADSAKPGAGHDASPEAQPRSQNPGGNLWQRSAPGYHAASCHMATRNLGSAGAGGRTGGARRDVGQCTTVAARASSPTTTIADRVITPISRRTIAITIARCSAAGSVPTACAFSNPRGVEDHLRRGDPELLGDQRHDQWQHAVDQVQARRLAAGDQQHAPSTASSTTADCPALSSRQNHLLGRDRDHAHAPQIAATTFNASARTPTAMCRSFTVPHRGPRELDRSTLRHEALCSKVLLVAAFARAPVI